MEMSRLTLDETVEPVSQDQILRRERGQGNINGKMNFSLSAFVPENLVSRDEFGSPVPRQPAHLQTQAESGAYLRDSSRFPDWCPFLYLNYTGMYFNKVVQTSCKP